MIYFQIGQSIEKLIVGTWESVNSYYRRTLTFSYKNNSNVLHWEQKVNGILQDFHWEKIGNRLITKSVTLFTTVENNHMKTRVEFLNHGTVRTYDRYIENDLLHVIDYDSRRKKPGTIVYKFSKITGNFT